MTHNIGGDLLLRMGVAGLALFVLAMSVAIAQGLRFWRRANDPLAAALALGLVAAVVGWLSKAMVESMFEKYRLAVLLGLLLGMLRSAVTTTRNRVGS